MSQTPPNITRHLHRPLDLTCFLQTSCRLGDSICLPLYRRGNKRLTSLDQPTHSRLASPNFVLTHNYLSYATVSLHHGRPASRQLPSKLPVMATTSNITPSPQSVTNLVSKLSDPDPDFRFMSLNDLLHLLNVAKPDFLQHDYNTAARAVDSIIKTLDDQNGEVQNMAVKWFA